MGIYNRVQDLKTRNEWQRRVENFRVDLRRRILEAFWKRLEQSVKTKQPFCKLALLLSSEMEGVAANCHIPHPQKNKKKIWDHACLVLLLAQYVELSVWESGTRRRTFHGFICLT